MSSLANSTIHQSYKYDTAFGKNGVTHTINGRREVWKKGERIGGGGFGEVHLYSNGRGNKRQFRAIKSVPRTVCRSDKKAIKRELNMLIALQDHQDLFVKFYGWCAPDDQNTVFIVMEYLPTGDLHAYTLSDPARAKENCRLICTQILKALNIMHGMEICHRDLKPQNILIASISPLTLKLADFGIAKSTKHDASGMRTIVGSGKYMAPEVLGLYRDRTTGRYYTKAVDIWALGSIIYELFTGLAPFCYYDGDISEDEDEDVEDDITNDLHKAVNRMKVDSQQYHTAKTTPRVSMDLGALGQYCSGYSPFPRSSLKGAGACSKLVEFLPSLMRPEPQKRLSASEALEQQWIKSGSGFKCRIYERSNTSGPDWRIVVGPNVYTYATCSGETFKTFDKMVEHIIQVHIRIPMCMNCGQTAEIRAERKERFEFCKGCGCMIIHPNPGFIKALSLCKNLDSLDSILYRDGVKLWDFLDGTMNP